MHIIAAVHPEPEPTEGNQVASSLVAVRNATLSVPQRRCIGHDAVNFLQKGLMSLSTATYILGLSISASLSNVSAQSPPWNGESGGDGFRVSSATLPTAEACQLQ